MSDKDEQELSKKERLEVRKEIAKQLSKHVVEKAKQPIKTFNNEFRKQTAAAIIAAFGFLIALVWKDLIVQAVDALTKLSFFSEYPAIGRIISAIIVTSVCVFGILLINRWAKKGEDLSKQN